MIKAASRVFETSITTGTGALNLAGAIPGFRSFVSAVGSGSKVCYAIDNGTDWEMGIGTVTAGSPDTLSRDDILESSNSNAAVNFGGTLNVRLSPLPNIILQRDSGKNFTDFKGVSGGTGNAHTVTMPITPIAYTDGMIVMYNAPAANTGAATVNVDSLGAKALKVNGADPANGLIGSGKLVVAVYNTANNCFDVINIHDLSSFAKTSDVAATYQPLAPRVQSIVSSATVTPTTNDDLVNITALAAALTINAPTGTPSVGQKLSFDIKATGGSHALTFNATYLSHGRFPLPFNAIQNKSLTMIFMWNGSNWILIDCSHIRRHKVHVYRAGAAVTTSTIFVADTAILNEHTAYNLSTGQYTVPYDGVLVVNYKMRAGGNTTSATVRVNGTNVGGAMYLNSTGYTGSAQTVINVQEGDLVDVYRSGGNLQGDNEFNNSITMYMLDRT